MSPRGPKQTRPRAPETISRALLVFLYLTLMGGCASKQIPEGKSVIEAIDIQGAPDGLDDDLEAGLATRKSPTFLGISGVYEYETYDEAALQKDIARVQRQLRRRGYYEARVSAARVIRTDEDRVRVELDIDPGDVVKIRSLKTTGLAQLPFDAAEAATNEIRLRQGQPFDEDQFEQAKQDVANALSDRGYAHARVRGKAQIDLASHSAQVEIRAEPGPQARLGAIRIEGLKKIDESPVRRTLLLKEGDLYSRADLNAARSALFGLGVFSAVEIIPDLDDKKSQIVPLTVRVQESALRDITIGAGARLDLLRFAAVGQASWTHRNFLGGLRKFSISTRPGLTFFPTSIDNLQAPTAVFPENALTIRLEQPGFLEGRTRGYTQAGYNVYPLLYPLPEDQDPRDETVLGYNEITTALGAERRFGGHLFRADLSLNWQANYPFAYQGTANIPGLDHVIVVYPELVTELDLRDDPLQPTSGIHLTNSIQSAVPVLGGSLLDVRIKPQLATFVPLDQKHKLVLASRLGVGLVFPRLCGNAESSNCPTGTYGDALVDANRGLDPTDPDVVADQHRLLFRALYSGGPNSNRGYPFRRIGPQGIVSFLRPSGECEDPNNLAPGCFRPLGGFTLWEASLELRYRAFDSWSFVAFVDASDVDAQIAHFSFTEPHVSIGPGVRYLSPVGPIRMDVGWRVPGLQRLEENPGEPPDVSDIAPYDTQTWYQSFALHILIGEAF